MHVQELNRLRASRKLDGREGNASHGTENLQGGDSSWRWICALFVSFVFVLFVLLLPKKIIQNDSKRSQYLLFFNIRI